MEGRVEPRAEPIGGGGTLEKESDFNFAVATLSLSGAPQPMYFDLSDLRVQLAVEHYMTGDIRFLFAPNISSQLL